MDDAQTLRSMVRDDAYRVVRVLGEGPSGRTELVTFDGEGPLVRKHIPASLANAAAWAAAMELDEPLLPRIEELYRMPDELVVVYDYVPGTALDELAAAGGRLPAAQAVGMVADVCRAVSALHGRGVVHRDITPGNVIVAADGAHLVDLGIARQRHEGGERDTTTLGTWGFAAPEQFGFAQTDARSDVYALGRLLGYLLTGLRPDDAAYDAALADARVVDEGLADVVRKACSFEPSARYQSAGELAEAARAALSRAEVSSAGTQRFSLRDAARGEAGGPEAHAAAPDGAAAESAIPVEPAAAMPAYGGDALGAWLARARGRGLAGLSATAKTALVAWWIVLGAACLVVAFASLDNTKNPEMDWGMAQNAMSVVVMGGAACFAFEAYAFAARAFHYVGEVRAARLLVARLCMYIGILFMLMMAVAIVLPS